MAGSLLRWGILGTGGIARTFVTDLRLGDSGVATAVGSRSQASADSFADLFGIANRYASYESLVADPDVDVIYVATPHPMHHDNAILALRAGKHVLVEKPFTMDAAEAREVVGVARESGRFAMEAMWTRFLPHVGVVRDWLARGLLGDIVTVTADHGQWFAEDPEFRLFAPRLGGGALLDLGVYPVSFASMVLGTPSLIVSISDPAFTGVDSADVHVVRLWQRRPRRAHVHAACEEHDESIHRRDRGQDRDRWRLLRSNEGDARPEERRGDLRRVGARGSGPAPSGRRGRAADRRRRHGEPRHATGRDDLDHGDDGHGPGAGAPQSMNGDGPRGSTGTASCR